MALLKCGDCGRDVSSFSGPCPYCGAAVDSRQATGPLPVARPKARGLLKLHVVIASLMFWTGLILLVSHFGRYDPWLRLVPGAIITLGLAYYVITKARIWWLGRIIR